MQKAAEIIHASCGALPRPQSASLAARCSPDLEKAALNSRGSAPTTAAVACLAALDSTRSNTEAGRSLWRLAALCHDLLRRRRHVGRAALVLGCVAKDWACGRPRCSGRRIEATLARMRDPHGAVFACVAREPLMMRRRRGRLRRHVRPSPARLRERRAERRFAGRLGHPRFGRAPPLRGWADVLDGCDRRRRNTPFESVQVSYAAAVIERTPRAPSRPRQRVPRRLGGLLEDRGDVRVSPLPERRFRHGAANPEHAPLLVEDMVMNCKKCGTRQPKL